MRQVTSNSIWGLHALRFVERHASARVAAVFGRSLHLESAGDFVCIGDPSIGRGPLNVVLDIAAWMRLGVAAPTVGTGADVTQCAIRVGNVVLDAARAEHWRPSRWPCAARGTGALQALQRLQHLAAERAPDDGLARAGLGLTGGRRSALERVARPRVERLREWVTARSSRCAGVPPPVDLLGLGPGLTPSGDDLLCGVLVALHAVGQAEMARDLDVEIVKAAPCATSTISAAFLRAAAEGLGGEALYEAICAILEGETETLAGHLEALGRIGHTSGWDALAGAVLVLQASGTIEGQRPGVAWARICE